MSEAGTILTGLDYYKHYKHTDDEIPLTEYLPDKTANFPTLKSLMERQVKIATSQQKKGPSKQGLQSDNKKPSPDLLPSRRRKEEIFNADKHADLDKAVRSVEVKRSDDWKTLSEKLFQEAKSDLQKVRAAFVFTCRDWSSEPDDAEGQDAPSDAYRAIAEKDYPSIFGELVRLGLGDDKVKAIKGCKKSADVQPGMRVPIVANPWHACFVDGEWRLVDAHWGATSVRGYQSGLFCDVNLTDGSLRRIDSSDGKDEFGCNEFFFLTDAEKLIVSHFPEGNGAELDKKLQLLAQPITKKQFEQMPHYFSGSEWAMSRYCLIEPVYYKKNVILADHDGTVKIFFEVPSELNPEFDATVSIYRSCTISDENGSEPKIVKIPGVLEKGIVVPSDKVGLVFNPPTMGKFLLTVRICEKGLVRLLAYTVHCPVTVKIPDETTVQLISNGTQTDSKSPEPTGEVNSTEVQTDMRMKFPMPALSRESLACLRSYSKPPMRDFNAVRATLLMLGFYEDRSRKWKRCQPLISAIPQAANDLILSSVHPRIAARCLEILDGASSNPAEGDASARTADETPRSGRQNISEAAEAFREWVEKNANIIKAVSKPEEWIPATVADQIELFGISEQEKAHWDWEDNEAMTDVARKFICYCDYCHVAIYNEDLRMHLHCHVKHC